MVRDPRLTPSRRDRRSAERSGHSHVIGFNHTQRADPPGEGSSADRSAGPRKEVGVMSSATSLFQPDETEAATVPSVRSLLYPGERWRFWMAAFVSAGFLALILYLLARRGATTVLGAGVFLLVVLGSGWWALQLMRARLLGNSVKVTAAGFPELYALLEDLVARLDYHDRIDVYVADKSDPSVRLTSYLGTRIILIEGGLVAELLDASRAGPLRFLIARHIGALKARAWRLDPLLVILQAANALQFVKPFLLPYYRSIAYSGDQIGLVCSGSVEAALEATGRLLVGKELADRLSLGGVLPPGGAGQATAPPALRAIPLPDTACDQPVSEPAHVRSAQRGRSLAAAVRVTERQRALRAQPALELLALSRARQEARPRIRPNPNAGRGLITSQGRGGTQPRRASSSSGVNDTATT